MSKSTPTTGVELRLAVACALVDRDGRVLLARRPEGREFAGLWEFPGGKVKDGELPEAALMRELEEEIGISVESTCLAPLAFTSHLYPGFHLLLLLYACRIWSGIPRAQEGQELSWAGRTELAKKPMPPANAGLVALLRDWL